MLSIFTISDFLILLLVTIDSYFNNLPHTTSIYCTELPHFLVLLYKITPFSGSTVVCVVREGMLWILGLRSILYLSSIFGQNIQPGYTTIFQAGSSGQNLGRTLTSITWKASTLLGIWLEDHLGDKQLKGHYLETTNYEGTKTEGGIMWCPSLSASWSLKVMR